MIVICTNNKRVIKHDRYTTTTEYFLTVGKHYKYESIRARTASFALVDDVYEYGIVDDKGVLDYFDCDYFIKLEDHRDNLLNRVLNNGL